MRRNQSSIPLASSGPEAQASDPESLASWHRYEPSDCFRALAFTPWLMSPSSPSASSGTLQAAFDPDKAGALSMAPGLPRRSPSLGASDRNETVNLSDSRDEWTVPEVAEQLSRFRQEVRENHAQLVSYIIESSRSIERRVPHGADLFAAERSASVPEKKATTMRFKFKHFLKSKKEGKEENHVVTCIKTDKGRVPRYRFHHVDIKKNVLTPNTMLTFVPHLRDLESSEETKYNLWLKELEDIDLKSGFKPMNREEKQALTYQLERAATIAPYLGIWLDKLAIPGCDKQTLVRYMASRAPDDAALPLQKLETARSRRDSKNVASAEDNGGARMFEEAFTTVFKNRLPPAKQVNLRRVLLLEESPDGFVDSKPSAKDGTTTLREDDDELAENYLATYCLLGCLICFSHSCDHGEYDNKNMKRTFSMASCFRLSDALKRRRRGAINGATSVPLPCARGCYRWFESDRSMWTFSEHEEKPWSEEEEGVLRSVFATASHSKYKGDVVCLAAKFLSRSCRESHAKLKRLGVRLPEPPPLPESVRVKSLSWYDRRRKALLGDWPDHTISHEHQRRETLEPCCHDGPCVSRLCPCVDAGLLCDKFCGCTADDCAYKFTGCACHSQGKTCQQKQKDKPCICVQLNRECDPQLCGSCGAVERADPLNADDEQLQATGCQNCHLQRGVGKPLILGQSQLEGVGYGLFTAQDIAQDDFIIEYVGELITHDEGVRREARRGDVFDEESNLSYVFTLLENDGIWVDAAIYGNLSRYINHASEQDKRGCNITPRILYVNGEYRIKFTAMRDIRAGEELFFNYGENFPNLTKKLLDHKAGQQAGKSNKESRRASAGDQVARKAPNPVQKRGLPKAKPTKKRVAIDPYRFESTEAEVQPRRRQRRVGGQESLPGTLPTSNAAKKDPQPKEELDEGLTRLRKRTRSSSGCLEMKIAEPPKKKSKRGGARPGSGRPRKHPRPVPKPPVPLAAPEGEDGASAAAAGTTPGATVDAKVESIENDSGDVAEAEAKPTTVEPKAKPVEFEAKPVDSTTTPVEPKAKPAEQLQAKPVAARDEVITPKAVPPDVVMIEDTDDETTIDSDESPPQARLPEMTEQADDDEDQDVVVRNRNGRAARNRRPPAKLREGTT
ncbi:hypothetical protein L249_1293 [Ophiocordyceps polyrhachis-furcata BCC 54312]|uniref:SET domain-containing protein n=1 Tax=Ophiocordyceps polyrhachis-furcata BCC 54312 TaxID=1330021 RepID=A0A367LD90_9HYPO|nr:hypothetical protein L249_1293 [Ophiocordyceps polyrhachis-furcata BCC 54312]